jgi:hypothetical protein
MATGEQTRFLHHFDLELRKQQQSYAAPEIRWNLWWIKHTTAWSAFAMCVANKEKDREHIAQRWARCGLKKEAHQTYPEWVRQDTEDMIEDFATQAKEVFAV